MEIDTNGLGSQQWEKLFPPPIQNSTVEKEISSKP
jgi:hypothetical protein